MKKIYLKLAASVMSILIAVTMIVGATYAWLTLSTSPEISGISITVGGGKVIMLAPDFTETVTDENGNQVVVHYPGNFSSKLNFSEYETYDYLDEVAGLSPVSTADGLYWMIPAYDEETGLLKELPDFTVDKTLENGNVTKAQNGSYIYLDFWMMSPGAEYSIHVSTDASKNSGSYLIELPGVEETEDGNLQLAQTQGIVEAIARVGFLVNTDAVSEADRSAYAASETYNTQYKGLLGVYPEKGQEVSKDTEYQFTIYEPNGVKHPSEELTEGEYFITKPLDYNPYGNTITESDIGERLIVQSANTWKLLDSGSQFEKIFEAAIINKGELSAEEAASIFYNEYLQGQIAAYVKSGEFYKSTADLYASAVNEVVSAETLAGKLAGATDDVEITTLQANTPQRVRMYLWMEGQDADCTNVNSVTASGFSMNIEFSGADQ